MEHNANAAPNHSSHGHPDQANLEAYGDWVTVAPDPAPVAESAPVTDAADNGGAPPEPGSRAAQDLTEAEEELLDQLAESERVAAAPAVATGGPRVRDPHATSAALAKLERQLSSLNADLKAVGQQLAELRGGVDAVPEAAAAPADAAPPAAPTFDAEAGDDPLAITLEELKNDPGPQWEAAVPTLPAAAGAAAEVPPEPQASVPPPGGTETPVEEAQAGDIQLVAEPESEPPAAVPVETLPAEDPAPEAPATAGGAEIGGQVREEVRSVLAYLDQLLDALPPDKVREFAQSKHFTTYKKLFREFDLDD